MRADRGGQADEVQALALEGVGCLVQPVARGAGGAGLQRQLDQPGMAAVELAEQVDGVGKVAGGVRAGRGEQGGELRMACRTRVGDARELRLDDASLVALDCRVRRHFLVSPSP